jgi:hypothetical protein
LFKIKTAVNNQAENSKNTESGKYEIFLSLRNPSKTTTINGFISKKDGTVLAKLPERQFENESVIKVSDTVEFEGKIPDDMLVLSVTAEYLVSGVKQSVTHTMQVLQQNPGHFIINVEHPSKNPDSGKSLPDDRKLGDPYKGSTDPYIADDDSGHIIVALARAPENLNDIDYLCGFGWEKNYQNRGQTRLGLPGIGTLQYQGGGDLIGYRAECRLYQETGGVAVVASDSSPDYSTDAGGGSIISITPNGQSLLNFSMPSKPKCANEYWKNNGMEVLFKDAKGTAFDYELRFMLNYDLGGNDTRTYNVAITSLDGNYGDADIAKVLPVKIVWGCLAAGTKVLTEEGNIAIDDIKIGNLVYSPNEDKYVKVTNVWRGVEKDEQTEISYKDKKIVLTNNHPVLTPNGYIRADKLIFAEKPEIIGEQGQKISVTAKKVPYKGKVYNLDTVGEAAFLAEFATVGTNRTQNTIGR